MNIRLKKILNEVEWENTGLTLPRFVTGYSAIHMFQPGFSFNWRYQKRNFKDINHLLKVMHAKSFSSDKREKEFQEFIDSKGSPIPYIFIDPYWDDVEGETRLDWGKTRSEAHSRMEDSADEI